MIKYIIKTKTEVARLHSCVWVRCKKKFFLLFSENPRSSYNRNILDYTGHSNMSRPNSTPHKKEDKSSIFTRIFLFLPFYIQLISLFQSSLT